MQHVHTAATCKHPASLASRLGCIPNCTSCRVAVFGGAAAIHVSARRLTGGDRSSRPGCRLRMTQTSLQRPIKRCLRRMTPSENRPSPNSARANRRSFHSPSQPSHAPSFPLRHPSSAPGQCPFLGHWPSKKLRHCCFFQHTPSSQCRAPVISGQSPSSAHHAPPSDIGAPPKKPRTPPKQLGAPSFMRHTSAPRNIPRRHLPREPLRQKIHQQAQSQRLMPPRQIDRVDPQHLRLVVGQQLDQPA